MAIASIEYGPSGGEGSKSTPGPFLPSPVLTGEEGPKRSLGGEGL
jgi:hypothetical protein